MESDSRATILVVSPLHVTPQASFACAFNIATADPFIDQSIPHYCEQYAWSGTFAGNAIGHIVSICVFLVLPLALGVNPKFFFLDV